MIISLNWIKKYTDIDISVDKLAAIIGERLVEIEEVIDLGAKYENVLVVKVVESNPIDGSDHLSLVKIDDNGVVKEIERDTNNLIQVVCGAPNVKVGQFVVWLPPKSTVPSTFNSDEPFVLGSRELRGYMSNGMIASAKELDLYDEHEGILEVDTDLPAGTSFAEAYELNDYLLDIENKSLTHRPDCFSIIGFAREVAAITGKAFRTPDWLMDLSPHFDGNITNAVELSVSIDDAKLSSRYLAVAMTEASGDKKSSLQIQTYLSRVGVRPISAVVDVTNYLMMLTGQPLHAFDYDKLVKVSGEGAVIHVRLGRKNEKLELLDGRNIELTDEDIVISAGQTAIGLAGAMGGASTAIDENTKTIIIESATFNLYNLRSTQMRHGIFSEAITRFTKGQPAALSAPVINDAIRLMSEWSGAKPVSAIAEDYPVLNDQAKITFSTSSINEILGCEFSSEDIVSTLKNVEFDVVQSDDGKIIATPPYWRADIHIIEDIVEEVVRLNGFDNVKLTLPERKFVAVMPDSFDDFRNLIRRTLASAGANETLNYSFIHGNVIEKSEQVVDDSYRIINSISPDLQYYRQTLTPSLLNIVYPNIKQGYDSFAIFEINKTHFKSNGLNDEGVPNESEMLSLVFANKDGGFEAPYYQAKKYVELLSSLLGIKVKFAQLEEDRSEPIYKPFEYRRSACILDEKSSVCLGVVGEYKKSVSRGFKLPDYTSGFEIDTNALFNVFNKQGKTYKPLSRYPSSERDICFKVSDSVPYDDLYTVLDSKLRSIKLETHLKPIDIYQAENATTKNITFRIKLTSFDHTLTGDEVGVIMESISSAVIEKTNAVIV